MVFICDHCHFLFSSAAQPEQCPDCGKRMVRAATEEEVREFERNNQERSPWEIVHVPDFCQAVMNRPDYFTFDLPISVFDLPDDIVMEVSVDYTRSEEQPIYLANVWARVKDSDSKHFLFSPAIPAGEDAARCIVKYLNEDDKFKHLMECFALDVARSFE